MGLWVLINTLWLLDVVAVTSLSLVTAPQLLLFEVILIAYICVYMYKCIHIRSEIESGNL